MSILKYIFFRIYKVYQRFGETQPYIYASGFVSLLLALNAFTVYAFFKYFFSKEKKTELSVAGGICALMMVTVFFYCIKGRRFVKIVSEMDEKADFRLAIASLTYLVITVATWLFIINMLRAVNVLE